MRGKNTANADAFASILTMQWRKNTHPKRVRILTQLLMGCALEYNKEEHSWDCPCHGSRFEENGNLINNPATDDMKRDKHKK